MEKSFNTKEKSLYVIWKTMGFLTAPFYFVGNWAVDNLNKSYYEN